MTNRRTHKCDGPRGKNFSLMKTSKDICGRPNTSCNNRLEKNFICIKIRLMQQIWTNIEGYGIRMDGGIWGPVCTLSYNWSVVTFYVSCKFVMLPSQKGWSCFVSLNVISENWWKLLISAFLSFSNALVLIHQHLNKTIQDTTYYWVTTITYNYHSPKCLIHDGLMATDFTKLVWHRCDGMTDHSPHDE